MKFVFIKKFITFLILINSHRYVQSSQLHLDSIFKLYDFLPNNHQKEFGFSFTSLSKNINYEGWLRISFETFLVKDQFFFNLFIIFFFKKEISYKNRS